MAGVLSEPRPLSILQEQLWYFSRLALENPVYNDLGIIHKDGDFDTDAFRSAFTVQLLAKVEDEFGVTVPLASFLEGSGSVADMASLVESAVDSEGARAVASRYACPGNDAPMDVFTTAEAVAECGARSLGWEEVHRGALRIREVPGGHVSMVTEPHVSVVAETLTESLRRAQEAGGDLA